MRRLSISRSPPELLAHCKSSGMRLLVQFCRMPCSIRHSSALCSFRPERAAAAQGRAADDCVSLTYTVCVLVNSCWEHCQVETHAK